MPERAVPHRCRVSWRASGVARAAIGSSSSKKLHLQRSYVIVDREAVPARVRPSWDHLGRARIHSSLLGPSEAPLPTPEHTRSTHTHTHTHAHTLAHTRFRFLLSITQHNFRSSLQLKPWAERSCTGAKLVAHAAPPRRRAEAPRCGHSGEAGCAYRMWNSLFATGKQQPPHKTSAACCKTQARRPPTPRGNTPPVCAGWG